MAPEAGFQASRDVDRVTFASYSYQGIDVAAIVIGRFDSAKIKLVASAQTPTKGGGTLVVSQYAGRDVYTVNNVGFTLLSDTRAIVGTEQGIRRVLERIKDKRVKRDIAPWMISTLETPERGVRGRRRLRDPADPRRAHAPDAVAARHEPEGHARRRHVQGRRAARGKHRPTPTRRPPRASSAVLKQSMSYAKYLAVFGIKLQNVDIKVDKSRRTGLAARRRPVAARASWPPCPVAAPVKR